ncbi:MAG: aminoacyl-tRNA hydrolase [Cyclobacteriaceae bacterium]
MSKFLIVGLGNIGPEYHETRHNIGFMVIDELAATKDVSFEMKRYGFITEFRHKGKTIYLLKPNTFMNLSGKSIRYWLKEKKIPVENLLVITDDVALPFGKLRTKTKGSSGGHNGLTNTEYMLETQHYARMRFGIGNNYPKGSQAHYVLTPFTPEEQDKISPIVKKASEACISFCLEGVNRMMNRYNG